MASVLALQSDTSSSTEISWLVTCLARAVAGVVLEMLASGTSSFSSSSALPDRNNQDMI